MITKYIQNTGTIPNAKVQAPNDAQAKAIEWVRFGKPPQEAMIMPPAIIPIEKATSMAVSRQTSSPKVRVTCNP